MTIQKTSYSLEIHFTQGGLLIFLCLIQKVFSREIHSEILPPTVDASAGFFVKIDTYYVAYALWVLKQF